MAQRAPVSFVVVWGDCGSEALIFSHFKVHTDEGKEKRDYLTHQNQYNIGNLSHFSAIECFVGKSNKHVHNDSRKNTERHNRCIYSEGGTEGVLQKRIVLFELPEDLKGRDEIQNGKIEVHEGGDNECVEERYYDDAEQENERGDYIEHDIYDLEGAQLLLVVMRVAEIKAEPGPRKSEEKQSETKRDINHPHKEEVGLTAHVDPQISTDEDSEKTHQENIQEKGLSSSRFQHIIRPSYCLCSIAQDPYSEGKIEDSEANILDVLRNIRVPAACWLFTFHFLNQMQSEKLLVFQQKKSEFPSSTMKGIKRTTNKKVGHYTFIKLIGKGAFSEVYLGVDSRNEEEVAIKMVSNDKLRDNLHRALQKEIEVLQEMRSCEYIVDLHNVLRTENNTYLVFEYCAGGDLHKYMKEKAYKLLQEDAQNVVYQLAKALSALRDVKIVHRDLKLSNILLSDTKDIKSSKIKLADFGLAKEFDHADSNKMLQTHCGTPINMAPEILERSPYTDKADLWSLGTIIYELVVGQPPYSGFNELELLNNIKARDPSFPPHLCLSPICIDLICKLLIRDSHKRMTWDQFFKHPFVAQDPAQFHKKILEARRKSNIPKRFYRPELRGQEPAPPLQAKNMGGLVQSEVESNYEYKMRDESTINQSKQAHDASDSDIRYYDSEKDNTQNDTETNYEDSSSVSSLKMQHNFTGKKQKHPIGEHTKTKLGAT